MKTLIKKSTGEYLSSNYNGLYKTEIPEIWADSIHIKDFEDDLGSTSNVKIDFTDVELIEVFVIKESDLPNSSDIGRAGLVFANNSDAILVLSKPDLIRNGYVNGFKDAIKLITKKGK